MTSTNAIPIVIAITRIDLMHFCEGVKEVKSEPNVIVMSPLS